MRTATCAGVRAALLASQSEMEDLNKDGRFVGHP